MAYVAPPPAYVVSTRDTARGRRRIVFAVGAWVAALVLALFVAQVVRERIESDGASAVLSQSHEDNAALEQRVSVLQRSEQVARAANAELQQTLRDRQEEIAGLRADLGFYSRLTGSARREGLAVQGIHLEPAGEARVYNFTITLTQNLKAGQTAAGRAHLSVSGVRKDQLATLGWDDLAPNQNRAGLEFSFKYFQQVKGALMLPEGFVPNRIRIEADAGGEMGRIDQDFAWNDALATAEVSDVQQQ